MQSGLRCINAILFNAEYVREDPTHELDLSENCIDYIYFIFIHQIVFDQLHTSCLYLASVQNFIVKQ